MTQELCPNQGEPPPAAGELVPWLLEKAVQAANADQPEAAGMFTWAAQVIGEQSDWLERQYLQPVPVSERPWEREGWCDDLGRCWLLDRNGYTWKFMVCGEWMLLPGDLRYRWLLPANALPLPS